MELGHKRFLVALTTFLLFFVLPPLAAAATLTIPAGGVRLTKSAVSLKDMRNGRLVRQGWDISCGAAALSTILQYHYRHKVTEAGIVVSILKNTDPSRVRARGGFSLLDLKRFVEALGYQGKGYGGLTLKDLNDFKMPGIIAVRIRGLDHFVVFRGQIGDRVLLGDPAFGNLTMPEEQFLEIWPNGIGFFVVRDNAGPTDLRPLTAEAMDMQVPDLNYVSRLVRGGGPVPALRRPLVVQP